MKRIKRTRIVIRHTEGFASTRPNTGQHEFDTCPLCHSVLDRDQTEMQIQRETLPHLLGDGEPSDSGNSNE